MKSLLIAAGLLALSLSAHAQETIVEYLSDDVVQTAFTENGSSDAQKLSSDGDEPICTDDPSCPSLLNCSG